MPVTTNVQFKILTMFKLLLETENTNHTISYGLTQYTSRNLSVRLKKSYFRFQFCGIWTVNHLINCGFVGWGGAFCWISVATCVNESHNNHKYCLPDKDANIALVAVLGAFCVLVIAFIIPTYYLYWKNRRAFHMGGGKCCPCC